MRHSINSCIRQSVHDLQQDHNTVLSAIWYHCCHMRSHGCRARATADYVTGEVIDNDVDLVLHVGDLSYANGDPEVSCIFTGLVTV